VTDLRSRVSIWRITDEAIAAGSGDVGESRAAQHGTNSGGIAYQPIVVGAFQVMFDKAHLWEVGVMEEVIVSSGKVLRNQQVTLRTGIGDYRLKIELLVCNPRQVIKD
jgi:hypothetical protein